MASDRLRAAVGSTAFFLVAPAVMAGVVPWAITRWRGAGPEWAVALGWSTTAAGALAVVAAFVQFVVEGRGTPAPVAPTQELVVGGLYRWVRNPMYLGVATAIAGQAIAFTSTGVALWLALFVLAVTSFVVSFEEPTLRRTYGSQYDDYCAAVPRWRPRTTPWQARS